MTSTATIRSGRTIVRRAAAFARSAGAWCIRDMPEAAACVIGNELIARGWNESEAIHAGHCVVWWALRGQTTGRLHGAEPPADELDVQLLVRRVTEGA